MAWRTAEDARRKKKQGEEEEQEQETRQIYKPGVERQKRQAAAKEVNASRREQAAKLGVGYLPGDVRVPGSPTQQESGFTGDFRHDAMLADRKAQQQSAWDVAGVSQRVSQTINNGLGMMGFGQEPNSERDYMEMRRFYQLMEDAGRDSGNTALIDRAQQGYGSYTTRLDDIERQRGQQLANAGGIDKVDAYYRMYQNAINSGDTERAEYARSMINSQADSYNDQLRFRRAPAATDTEGRANDWQERYNRGQEGYVVGMMTGNQELVDRSRQYMEWANSNYGKAYGDLLTETQGPAAGYAYKYNLQELTKQRDAAWAKVEAARSAYDAAAEKANARAGEADYEWNANPRDDPTFAKEQEALAALRAAEADYEVWKQAIVLEKGDEFAELEDRIPKAAAKTNRTPEGSAVRGQILKGQAAFRRHEEEAVRKTYGDENPGNPDLGYDPNSDYYKTEYEKAATGYAWDTDNAALFNLGRLRENGYSDALKQNEMGWGMTEDQKQTFYYLYAEDPAKAEEFAEACKRNAEDAYYAEMAEAETNPAARLWKEFKGANLKLIGGAIPFTRTGQKLSKEGTALAQSVGAGREAYGIMNTGFLAGKLPEEIPIIGGKSLNDWTQLKSSMIMSGETAAAAKVAMATGHPEAAAIIEIAGLYMQSGAAANDDYIEMKRNGWSDNAALTHALFAGVAEATFEKVSLESLVNQNISRGFVRNLLTQAGIEASEEVATTIANHITDAAIARVNGYDNDRERRAKEYMGQGMSYNEAYNKADVDIMTDLLDDALGGFLSGGLMTGGNYASQGLMTGAGKVVSGIRNTRGIYTGENLLGMGEDVNLHQKASEGAVNQVQNDSTGETTKAMKAYADANKISVKSKDSTRAVRANVETVTDSIADKMYSKPETVDGRMEGAVAVYSETVSEYGEGIKPVAKAALTNTVNKIVSETSSRGSVTATTAFQAQVDAIQDPEAKQIAQAALDQAVIRKAGNATQNSERMEGLRHLTEKRHTPVKLEAIVTDMDGKETTTGIKGFSSDGSSVVLDNGTEVKVEGLQTTDSDVKDAIDAIHAAKLGGLANVVFQSYLAADLSHSAKDSYRWIAGYVGAINQGITHSITVQQAVEQNARMFGLDEETVRQAYELGETLRNDPKVQARKQGLQKAVELAKEKGVKGRKAKIDTSRIQGIKISSELQAHITAVNRIAKAVGVDVVWFSSKNADGSYSAMSGKHADGTIWLDIESGKNSAGDVAIAILGTMSHELTHFIQQYSNDLYMELQDLAMQHLRQQLGEDGLEQLILDTVKKNGFTGDNAKVKAMEELTAQFCEKMFSMEESMQPVLADVQQNHKGLWAKIKEFFQGFIEKVRKLIEAGETAQKSEALQAWENISEEMQKVFAAKWGEALRSAKQTHDAVTGLEAAGIQVEGIKNTAQEGGEQFSVRSIVGQSGTNYGIGVYLDSTLLEGLTEDERVEMVKERIKELGGQAFTAYDGAGNAVQIRIAQPSQRFRNANGKRVRVNKDLTEKFNRNSVKQEAVVLVDELISTAKEGQPNPARHPHGWLDDNGQNPWVKWTTYIQEKNGSVWLAYLNIATATDGTKHLYDVDPIKIVEQAGTSATSPQQQNAAGIRVPQNAANVNPSNEQHQTRPSDTVSDVDLLLQQKVEDATNREQGRLLKEFQAKARQVQELEAKLEQAKAQLKRTDRSYNTRGIQKLIGDTMKTFGMGDAKNVGIRKTAAEMLNKAYDKAIAAIDRGDSAGALDEVYQGAVAVAEYLLDNGTYREKQGFRWDRAQWAQVYANTEEARQHAIDEVVSTVCNDFASNRYREAVQATAVDRIVDRVEAKYTEKLDAAKAQNKALQETNEKLEQDRDFFREVSDQTKDIADNLYTELKETREELKEAKRTNSKDTKRLQQKADKLAQDLKKANQQAKDWRDKAQHLGSFAQQLVDSKNRDIQGLRQDLAAAHEKLQAAASQIEEMKGWEEKAKHAGVYSQQLIDSKNRDIAKLEKEIQKHRDILAGKLRNPQLTAMLKNAREAVYNERNQRIQDIRDQRKRTELRKRIKNLADDMKRTMTNPTDRKYVPASLYGSMTKLADALDDFLAPNDGTKAAERYRAVMDKIHRLSAEYQAVQNLDDPTYKDEYDEEIQHEINEIVRTLQGATADAEGSISMFPTKVRDLTTEELQKIYNIMHYINYTMKNASSMMGDTSFQNVYDAMRAVVDQQQTITPLNEAGKHEVSKRSRILHKLSTMRAVEMMSGWDREAALYQMMQRIERGVDESNGWVMNYDKAMQDLKNGKNELEYRRAISKKLDYQVKDARGNRVLMTKMQAIQILMTEEREAHNDKLVHLQQGGAVIRDRNAGTSYTIKVTPELIQRIQSNLSEWDKAYMKTIRSYFQKEGKRTNEILYKLKRRVLQTEEFYVPYNVDKNYLDTKLDSPEAAMKMWVRTPGSTNALTQKASQPVYIDGMDTVMGRHVREIANYIGLALPIRDFSKVYNGMLKQGEGENPLPVKETIFNNYGEDGQKLLTQAIIDVQGSRKPNEHRTQLGKLLEKLQSFFYRKSLLINAGVTIKQAASYVAAESILDHRAIIAGNRPIFAGVDDSRSPSLIAHLFLAPSGNTAQRLFNEIDEHTSLHWQRRQGMSMQELAQEANRSGKLKTRLGLMGAGMEQVKGGHTARKIVESIDPLNWIQRMDVATTAALWVACKEQAKLDGMQIGTEEFWQHSTELYERCIRETQPMYDTLHRSEAQKDRSGLMQYLFPFRTVPIQNHGQLAASYEALQAAQKSGDKAKIKKAWTFFRKTAKAQVMSAAVFAAFSLFANALKRKTKKYRDDDEELTLASLGIGLGLDTVGTLFSVFFPMYGSAIWDSVNTGIDYARTGKEAFSYDTFSIGVADMLNNVWQTGGDLGKDVIDLIAGRDIDSDKVVNHIGKFITSGLECAGIPATTAKTYWNGIKGNFDDLKEGRLPALNDESWVRSTSTDARRFIKALEAGNSFKAGNVLAGMKKNIRDATPGIKDDKLNSRVQNAINTYIHEQILSGGITEKNAISYMVQYGGKTEDDAYWAIQEWRAKELHKGDDDYSWSPYEGIREDIDNGEKWENIKKSSLLELTEHGKDVSDIYQAITEHIHKRFDAGELTEDEAMELMQAYSWKKDDKTKQYRRFTASEAYFKLEEWKAKAGSDDVNWSQYNAMRDALRKGGDVAAEIRDLLDHDVKEKDVYREYGDTVKEQLVGGNIDETQARQLLLQNWKAWDSDTKQYRQPTEDEVWWKVREWSETAANKDTDGYNYAEYRPAFDVIDANGDVEPVVRDMVAHGKDEKKVRGEIKNYLVEKYVKEGRTDEWLRNTLSRYSKIVKHEDVDPIVNDAKCRKSCGISLEGLNEAYKKGTVDAATVKRMLTSYGGKTADEANKRLRWLDLQKQYPDLTIDDDTANRYYDGTKHTTATKAKTAAGTGLSFEKYLEVRAILKKVEGVDANGDGRADNYSREKNIIKAIDGMNLTSAQKWALYYEEYEGKNWKNVRRPNW